MLEGGSNENVTKCDSLGLITMSCIKLC